jgi:hypothetical protein
VTTQSILGEIEWKKYPVSERVLTKEQAAHELAMEKSTYGSCISQVTSGGEYRVLIAGQWHRVEK